MKKKVIINLSKLFLITWVLQFFLIQSAHAQRPIPKMWVPFTETESRMNWFNNRPYGNSKSQILSLKLGYVHPQSIRIPVSSFRSLIDTMDKEYGENFEKLNLYITAFDPAYPGPLNPATTRRKQLILVFAPAGTDGGDKGKFYIINPINYKCQEISLDIKNHWVLNYISNLVNGTTGLASTLDQSDELNRAPDGSISDTRRITYEYSSFKDFVDDERRYQNENGNTNPNGKIITHIQISFASYVFGIGQNDSGYPINSLRDRLIILFDFIREGSIFYIDKQKDFPDRLSLSLKNKKINGFDNGQLCPPSSNCPTEKH